MVAISADRPEKLAQSRMAGELGYGLYSDSPLAAARAFGIVYQVDPETVARMKGFGIDLAEASGEGHHQLPVPSVFLVDSSGVVRWRYSNPDYKVRPENEALLAAARALAEAEAAGPGLSPPAPGG